MSTNIIERNVTGKKGPGECEDGIALTDDFIAVIDGSTSKSPFRIDPDMTNGQLAMLTITSLITGPSQTASAQGQRTVSLPSCLTTGAIPRLDPSATVGDFCQAATACLKSVYDRLGITSRLASAPEMRPCASCAVLSLRRKEIWMIGDCQAMVDGTTYDNPKPYEEGIARQRAQLINQGTPPADARKAIEPLIVTEMRGGQNRTYAVIDGFPTFMPGVKVIPVTDHAEVVLATDGYPFLRPTLAESELLLERQLADDPQNVRSFIATKGLKDGQTSFDDRSYIRLTF